MRNFPSAAFVKSAVVVGACLASVLVSFPVAAGTWTLNVENDRIANTDRHYTNGVRLGWVSEAEDGGNLPEVRDTLQMLYPLDRKSVV